MRVTRWAVLWVATSTAAACGGDGGQARLQVERDTVGDTVIVRTLAGSEWGGDRVLEEDLRIGVFEGEDHYMLGDVAAIAVAPDGSMYLMDRQVPALRKYGPDGGFIATFGREGEGPGEYRGPDGGLVVLSDGRVAVRDPRNGRIQVFSATGEPVATWTIRGNFNTSNPMVADTADRVYTQILMDPEASVTEWRMGMLGIDGATGEEVDTVAAPTWDYEEPRLIAQRKTDGGTSTSVNGVPFSPDSHWAFSPYGYMVGGLSTRYAVDVYRRDGGVLRIERQYEPVPVHADEKSNREDQTRWNMRRTQPDWKWNGPAIPDTKPPFRDILVGLDGRIWVQLHQPGERVPDHEIEESSEPDARPATRWREPNVFDVYEADGTYLGQVHAPSGISMYPTPVFDRDYVYAIVRDELDVQYLTRFRISSGATETSAD